MPTQNKIHITKLFLAAILAIVSWHNSVAVAALGGDAASVETDRQQMRAGAAIQTTPSAGVAGGYTVHETTLPSGTLVRQYVSSAGAVFAVGWNGPYPPNLEQLLGTYFPQFVAIQAGQNGAGTRSVTTHTPDFVIEAGGHQRDFAGRAYLPAMLPNGVNTQDIR